MKSNPARLLTLSVLLMLPMLMSIPSELSTADLPQDDQIHSLLMQSVGQTVANDAARVFGAESAQFCIVTETLSVCLHPDTPPERVDEILRNLPTWSDDKYQLGNRWSTTAVDGSVGLSGPINLTYSFLDDGVWIPGAEEPGSGSRLYAEMNSHFGSEEVWKAMFAEIFNDWGKHIGVTYQEVSDDGAAFTGSPGEVGLRGDVRIGAHNIDGQNGVLAYNYFPNSGDMVLDTSENWSNPYGDYVFMRNICRHEHGHGLGLQHVSPTNCQKLMEPYVCLNFDGPQDDDLRGGMRAYGDTYESNNTASAATDLGVIDGVWTPEFPVSLTTSVDFDYYRFTTTGSSNLSVTVDPAGHRYAIEDEMIDSDEIMDLAFRVLGGSNGSEILIHVNETGLGENEAIVDFSLPTAGDYWVLVFRAAGTPDVQRYDLDIEVEASGTTAVGDQIPRTDLGLSVYPNPFNPRTTARFYVETPGSISLDIYDVAGKRVRSIHDQTASVGWQELSWNGRSDTGNSVPSGTYLMQVRAGGRIQTVRGLLLE